MESFQPESGRIWLVEEMRLFRCLDLFPYYAIALVFSFYFILALLFLPMKGLLRCHCNGVRIEESSDGNQERSSKWKRLQTGGLQ